LEAPIQVLDAVVEVDKEGPNDGRDCPPRLERLDLGRSQLRRADHAEDHDDRQHRHELGLPHCSKDVPNSMS
jgi:hypothetical protein